MNVLPLFIYTYTLSHHRHLARYFAFVESVSSKTNRIVTDCLHHKIKIDQQNKR